MARCGSVITTTQTWKKFCAYSNVSCGNLQKFSKNTWGFTSRFIISSRYKPETKRRSQRWWHGVSAPLVTAIARGLIASIIWNTRSNLEVKHLHAWLRVIFQFPSWSWYYRGTRTLVLNSGKMHRQGKHEVYQHSAIYSSFPRCTSFERETVERGKCIES